MRMLSAMLAVSLLACGGESIGGSDGLGGTEPGGGSGGSGTGGADESGGTAGAPSGGSAAGGSPYVEPECPDEPPPPPVTECDPMDPLASCELYGPGYGCYTFLQYPEVPGCGFPESGALCAQASTGTQGDFCGEDLGNYCEPSYMCVVGALGGKRCAQICSVYGESGCPLGLLCGETDVPGYGVCF